MNYQKIYNNLINKAKNRNCLVGYTEKHHIIPKCMGGSNDIDNLVELTSREHFLAHKLLCEIYSENHKLQYALWMMCNVKGTKKQNREYVISSREYERLRKRFGKSISKKLSGVPKSKEHKDKISKVKKNWHENNKHPMSNRNHSVDAKKKMSERRKEWHRNNKDVMFKSVRHIKTGKVFKSGEEAANYFDISKSTVSVHCNGRYKTQKFEFVE